MSRKLKCWRKIKGHLWENDIKSRKAQRHIIERIGVSPIGIEGNFVVYKEVEDEKFLTSKINALKTFKDKTQSLGFAKSYMRKHDKC